MTAAPVAPGTAQVSVSYTAQSGKSPPPVTVAEITIPDTIAVCKDQTREIPITLNPSPLPSGATVELSLNTVAGTGAATFDDGSTSISLTQSTTVIVTGVSPSESMDDIELKAMSASKEIAKDNLSVIFVTKLRFRGDGPIFDNNSQKADLTAAGLTTLGLIDDNSLIIGALVEVTADVKPSNFNKPIRLARKKTRIAYRRNPGGSVFFDETPPDTDDTGATPADAIRDDDPQPDGKIYDVDIPGFERIDLAEIDVDETIMSRRANFRQFAEYQEPGQTVFQKCSEVSQDFDLRWFDRQSIELTDATTNTWVRENSVPTDNEVGEDTTSLKIDLSN